MSDTPNDNRRCDVTESARSSTEVDLATLVRATVTAHKAIAMNAVSMFAGIGGIDLGLERAGIMTVAQIELDPWRRSVLEKNWPEVPKHDDCRTFLDWWRTEPRPRVDVVAGGFPCKDVSKASRTSLGIEGPQSGLWWCVRDAVEYLRPRYVLVENVSALLVRGLDRVLADLHALGYDAEWDCLHAAAFGAAHIRDRLFVVAYPRGERHRTPGDTVFAGRPGAVVHGGWPAEPDVGRMADGISRGLDGHRQRRVGALGDTVVPQVIEYIGRGIVADSRLAQIPRNGAVLNEHAERVHEVGAEAVVAEFSGDSASVRPERIGDANVA